MRTVAGTRSGSTGMSMVSVTAKVSEFFDAGLDFIRAWTFRMFTCDDIGETVLGLNNVLSGRSSVEFTEAG